VALLGPLAWNGGPTLTHAPQAGSPLVDTADLGNCPPTDQRGGARPVDGDGAGGARCDKGAYEVLAVVARYFLPAVMRWTKTGSRTSEPPGWLFLLLCSLPFWGAFAVFGRSRFGPATKIFRPGVGLPTPGLKILVSVR